MNVRRIPALFALMFAASACTPTLVMLEYAPQAPATAYDVGLDVSTGGPDQPSVPPVDAPTYDVSTAGPGQASAPPVSGPANEDSTGAGLPSTAPGSEQSSNP